MSAPVPHPPALDQNPRSLGLLWKIMLATLLAGLIPLAFLSLNALQASATASREATTAAVAALDQKEQSTLRIEMTQTVHTIARLLQASIQDTLAVAALPHTANSYLPFYQARHQPISYPGDNPETAAEQQEQIPLYREMAFINGSGREELRIVNGIVALPTDLRDVSNPANTTYLTEDYFNATLALLPGDVYVSHVTAWHTSNPAQPAYLPQLPNPAANLQNTSDGVRYRQYEAVIRFASKVFDEQGQYRGMVVLSLDARHIIEPVIHILPASSSGHTPWPDYNSGDYAYMFDDEGYLIAHPYLSRLRGLDATGTLVSPIVSTMTDTQRALHPYNMNYDAEHSAAYTAAMHGEASFSLASNVAGISKANVTAPIPFTYGVYRKTGIFGGIVIGANVADFHQAATQISESIAAEQRQIGLGTIVIVFIAIILLITNAIFVARGVTRPLRVLTEAARHMEQGELDTAMLNRVINRRLPDELTRLARVFKQMAEQVQLRERRLKQQILQLHIQIDEQKKQQQVAEITESDYFQSLRASAQALRARNRGAASAGPPSPPPALDEAPGNGHDPAPLPAPLAAEEPVGRSH